MELKPRYPHKAGVQGPIVSGFLFEKALAAQQDDGKVATVPSVIPSKAGIQTTARGVGG